MVGDRPREEHLPVAPALRDVAVERESSEQPPTADERDERQRADALPADGALERRLEPRAGDVVHEHGRRILDVLRPRRVSLGGGAIAVGEPAPGAETGHAVVVGEQHRGPVGAGRFEERVERRFEHLVECLGAGDGVGEAVDGVEVAQAPAQLLAFAHVAGRAEHEAKVTRAVADGGSVHLEPAVAPVGPQQPDRDGVDVGSRRGFVPRLGGQGGVVGMDQLEHRRADERCRLPAETRPGRRRVDDHSRQLAERDEIVRALHDEPTDGVVDALGSGRKRLRPAARGSSPRSLSRLLVAVCPIRVGKTRDVGSPEFGQNCGLQRGDEEWAVQGSNLRPWD